ncbi:hypothetical protein VHEMI07364 [[Torrubiella] hemipterigena]|uniref:Kelch domain-containing protein n=1 Tax=[Torrubiella] hemipterigena TaxID=1531966 RepID=A0A0A1T3E6_9HYPO|nr:hypothetical protein VHEMI07364 [[Torrubiella] hemipterigena]
MAELPRKMSVKEQFTNLQRRTSLLVQKNIERMPTMPAIPAIPAMPAMPQLPPMPTIESISSRTNSWAQQLSRPQGKTLAGTWEKIDVPSIPRSSHTVNIVGGSAYIFGGEISPREPVDNDMHVVRLPLSGASADYYQIKATNRAAEPAKIEPQAAEPKEAVEKPESKDTTTEQKGLPKDSSMDDVTLETPLVTKDKGKALALGLSSTLSSVPEARVGHATALIGSRIFLFGGRGGPDMKPLEEAGRVWVFDTRTNTWSYLDPAPAIKGGAIVPHPAARSYHCATSYDRPQEFGADGDNKPTETWQEWALGDTSKTGIPQDPVVGYVAENAVDEEARGYGTFIIHGGCLAGGDRTCDIWAFDIASRKWLEIPAAPGPARGGTSITIHQSRLYRFGGFDGKTEIGGQLDFLDIETEMFEDGRRKTEGVIRPKGGWQSVVATSEASSDGEVDAWPSPRSVSSLEVVPVPGGRDYLVVSFGETAPSSEGHAGAGKFLRDIWAYPLPPAQGITTAHITATLMSAIGRKPEEAKWFKVASAPFDPEESQSLPKPRGWLASATITDYEESGVLVWGGLGEDSRRMGDGWILRLA